MRRTHGLFGGQSKLLYSIFGSIAVFLLFQCGIIWRDFVTLEDQKMTLQAEIESKQRKLDEFQLQLHTKERDIYRMERKLGELESKLKGKRERIGTSQTTIFMITPTHKTPNQRADLTRLSHTLMHVPDIRWIVIEDSSRTSPSVADILNNSGLQYTHLNALTPQKYKLNQSDPNWKYPRGVNQRNAGLNWIRSNIAKSVSGVVYFGDDDNAYDLKLFKEMRSIIGVGVWPVGIVGGLMVERPLMDAQGIVTHFFVAWKPNRPFPIDMAGFAINLRLIHDHPEVSFSFQVARGYQESQILERLIGREQLEPKAEMCTKVYVWHTRTEKANLKNELVLNKKGIFSDQDILV